MPKIETLKDLIPDPQNANRGTARGAAMLESSLAQYGAGRGVVVDRNGVIIAGNKTVEQAKAMGLDVVSVHTDGTQLVVTVRDDLDLMTDAKAKALGLADNRVGQVNLDFDPDMLTALAEEVDVGQFWSVEEFGALLNPSDTFGEQSSIDIEPQIDKAAELQEKYGTALGQVWELGEHRLVCGDCTIDIIKVLGEDETINLVWTDPPYGVSYGDKNKFLNAISPGNRIQKPIESDNGSEMDTELLCRTALAQAVAHVTAGACAYVTVPAGPLHRRFIDAFNASGFTYKHQLIWIKNKFVLGRSDYHYRHEPILYGWKENGPHYWGGGHSQDTVFQVDKPHVSDMHPTMKPVLLVEKMIQNSSRPGGIVYDPFLGSGTTLIACENLKRKCRAIEIDPGYVAVSLHRWATLTGQEPKII